MQMFFDLVGSLSIAIKVSPSKQIELYANLTLRSQVTFNDQKLVVNGDLCVWVCVCAMCMWLNYSVEILFSKLFEFCKSNILLIFEMQIKRNPALKMTRSEFSASVMESITKHCRERVYIFMYRMRITYQHRLLLNCAVDRMGQWLVQIFQSLVYMRLH